MMLQAGWLIVNLIAGALTAPAAAMQPSGISCTYQACMMKCGKLNSPICNSYCEAKVAQRVAARICPTAKASDQDSHFPDIEAGDTESVSGRQTLIHQ